MNATGVRVIGLSLLIFVPACSPSTGPSRAKPVTARPGATTAQADSPPAATTGQADSPPPATTGEPGSPPASVMKAVLRAFGSPVTTGQAGSPSAATTGQADSPPAATTGVQRNGIEATAITTEFEYGKGINAAMGIPSGAKSYRTENRKKVGSPVAIASNAELVDEPSDGTKARLIRVNYSLRDASGNEVAKLVAFFKPFADESHVVKTILDDRYESMYKWGEMPGHTLVHVTTIDRMSGTTVLETKNLEFIRGSEGLFRGEEHHFASGKVVCVSAFVRHFGTGLLVAEQAREGALPKDFHTYEFVLSGWPSGRSPGFGSGVGSGTF